MSDEHKQALSALADGALDDAALLQTVAAWRHDAGLRESWHAYQLIGDALRSEDLVQVPAHDEAFLQRLRGRLADEPVVLAPQRPVGVTVPQVQAGVTRRRSRTAPVAVAASFFAVAGVLVASRFGQSDPSSALVTAQASNPVRLQTLTATSPASASEALFEVPADGKLIRDVRLDRYLAAHKQYGGSSAVSVPGVVLRSAATVAPDR
jgi:sigma-E factor negative regulatory protein RseA